MKNIAVVFGCGGHRAQADRFYNTFSSEQNMIFHGVTDEGGAPAWCASFLTLEPLRDKYSGKIVSFLDFLANIYRSYKFLRANKISTLVSFGPGVAIFVGVAARIAGCTIIHFETWSKFYSPTMTTRVMRYLTKNIFIQNIELKDSVPYGNYVGRF